MTERKITAFDASEDEILSDDNLRRFLLDYRQMKSWVRDPMVITGGEGVWIRDVHGRALLDAKSGVYAVNVGHGNKAVLQAMREALDSYVFAPPLDAANMPAMRLVKLLGEIAPGNLRGVKLLSGGSESIEAAIKLSRQYHKLTGNPRKYKIMSLYDSYHGATLGALSASGGRWWKQYSQPLAEGFFHVLSHNCYRCPFDLAYPTCGIVCAKIVEQTIQKEDPNTIAAMILEPIIQVQGCMTPPPEYLPMVREICTRYNIVLIYDEIITAFGRSGDMFAANVFGAVPDIIVCGKGMSSGYAPLSACLIDEKIVDALWSDNDDLFFEHGHTYAAYMLAAVAGLAATRELLTRDLPGNAKRMEGYLKDKLRALDSRFGVIGDIRGKGLMVAAELVADKATKLPFPVEIGKMVAKTSLKYGLLHRAGSQWISIAPPLIATKEDIDEILVRLEKSLGDVMEAIS